ncbi:stage II sporulation protein AA (anti-sigma F factor antagonist) [Streptomyces sp. SAI-135]|uniref:STAS domain-containing protein n=1 Tax=unclassified Streptomyces TaxID=2593676 RepID=UPI002473B79D|nr:MULTISPECIES: STAS domain-containing protein [unclassified Streptomyces]MDH6514776.1 stage II sporulation protein AA (anti-sigma F factor antagonist) [Streptomyces sp. SAI-090]MDH6546957.1 stage II sporulation protein AA (anti-sigma F factor antagonist) [Streptomyces sp. SAI-041]MDH6621142.1 stage II sporulation protein AA (anti-sigma F factor antagonist) [Streptomyces sp. SAI-135]
MTDISPTGRPERLSIAHSTVDGIRVVTLHGDIDHDVKDALTTALLPEDGADDGSVPRVVVDLGGVAFLDSTGINVFVHVHHKVSAARGWLRLAAAQEPVTRVVQLVGLDTVIACHPTLEQALRP